MPRALSARVRVGLVVAAAALAVPSTARAARLAFGAKGKQQPIIVDAWKKWIGTSATSVTLADDVLAVCTTPDLDGCVGRLGPLAVDNVFILTLDSPADRTQPARLVGWVFRASGSLIDIKERRCEDCTDRRGAAKLKDEVRGLLDDLAAAIKLDNTSLTLAFVPPGLRYEIDGQVRVPQGPIVIAQPGRHVVTIAEPCWDLTPAILEIDAPLGQSTTYNVEPTPRAPTLRIISHPTGATVAIDGEARGSTDERGVLDVPLPAAPPGGEGATARRVRVVVAKAGWRTHHREVAIAGCETITEDVVLWHRVPRGWKLPLATTVLAGGSFGFAAWALLAHEDPIGDDGNRNRTYRDSKQWAWPALGVGVAATGVAAWLWMRSGAWAPAEGRPTAPIAPTVTLSSGAATVGIRGGF